MSHRLDCSSSQQKVASAVPGQRTHGGVIYYCGSDPALADFFEALNQQNVISVSVVALAVGRSCHQTTLASKAV